MAMLWLSFLIGVWLDGAVSLLRPISNIVSKHDTTPLYPPSRRWGGSPRTSLAVRQSLRPPEMVANYHERPSKTRLRVFPDGIDDGSEAVYQEPLTPDDGGDEDL